MKGTTMVGEDGCHYYGAKTAGRVFNMMWVDQFSSYFFFKENNIGRFNILLYTIE